MKKICTLLLGLCAHLHAADLAEDLTDKIKRSCDISSDATAKHTFVRIVPSGKNCALYPRTKEFPNCKRVHKPGITPKLLDQTVEIFHISAKDPEEVPLWKNPNIKKDGDYYATRFAAAYHAVKNESEELTLIRVQIAAHESKKYASEHDSIGIENPISYPYGSPRYTLCSLCIGLTKNKNSRYDGWSAIHMLNHMPDNEGKGQFFTEYSPTDCHDRQLENVKIRLEQDPNRAGGPRDTITVNLYPSIFKYLAQLNNVPFEDVNIPELH